MADAHHAEATAAVAAMTEFYGRSLTWPKTILRDGKLVDTYAIGDYVEFVAENGDSRRGYVIQVNDGDVYLVRCHVPGGAQEVIAAHIDDFRPF